MAARSDVSRRGFVTGMSALGLGAAATAASQTGLLKTMTAKAAETAVPESWDYEYDIVVCGAGGAGLLAALKANDEGCKVICIDEAMDDAAEEANLTLLADATRASIAKLQERGGEGFFLMVEGAKIDYAGHSRCLPGSVIETLSFDLAVAEALKFADTNGETLVIVTADHETGGLVVVDGDEHTGRVTGVYVSDDHTPAMLPVFAYGPGADKFCGTYMNTEIARRIKSLIK